MVVNFQGIPEKIVGAAIASGLAKTKTDVLMLGLIELEHKYKLLEKLEDEEDLKDSLRIEKEVAEGKQKLYSAKEFEKKTGFKIRR